MSLFLFAIFSYVSLCKLSHSEHFSVVCTQPRTPGSKKLTGTCTPELERMLNLFFSMLSMLGFFSRLSLFAVDAI